jgi:hypothetical protein
MNVQNFGMAEGQITLMKQNKVPAMLDAEARFAGAAALAPDWLRAFCSYRCLAHRTLDCSTRSRAVPRGDVPEQAWRPRRTARSDCANTPVACCEM